MSLLQVRLENFFANLLKKIHLSDENEITVTLKEYQVMEVLNAIYKAKILDEIRRVLGDTEA